MPPLLDAMRAAFGHFASLEFVIHASLMPCLSLARGLLRHAARTTAYGRQIWAHTHAQQNFRFEAGHIAPSFRIICT